MQTTSKVTCPIPSLEAVVVEYNMLASEEQIEIWAKSMGEVGMNEVIVSVENWPIEKYGEPFSRTSPFGFRIWACKPALELAMQAFLAEATS